MAAKERRQKELKQRLLDLKMGQEKVVEKLEVVKEEQRRLKELLENKTEQTMGARQEAAKLRPYTTQSPGALESSLKELSANLAADRAQIDQLDRRGRALQTSSDTFTAVTADVEGCTRLLKELAEELKREEDQLNKAQRHRDALSERSNNVRDVERQEKLLRKQLTNVTARTEKLRKGAEEKAELAKGRMEELRSLHRKLTEERGEKGREADRRRVRIEQTEKKVRPCVFRPFPTYRSFLQSFFRPHWFSYISLFPVRQFSLTLASSLASSSRHPSVASNPPFDPVLNYRGLGERG